MSTSTKKVGDYQYLIVGGTTKAATTSLFAYLADHPAICGATYKETRFFLGSNYPLPSKYRYTGDVEEYNLLFPLCDENQVRLDSTPDYLYCPHALERIAKFLPHAKLVFSLREPISRLVSWYRFAKQIGKLPQDLSFDAYVKMLFDVVEEQPQMDNMSFDAKPIHEQYMQALRQGCYASYLKEYFKQFESNRLYTLFYEDLAVHPSKVLTDLCNFAGIDAKFYEDYAFKVTNRTETMKNTEFHKKYRDFRFRLRRWTHNKPIIHNPLKLLRRKIEPLYLRLNTRPTENVNMSEVTQNRLVDYYKSDVRDLTELIGKMPPWEQFSSLS
ncbi:sulfotransferase [Candidatus Poribacteria bacterium]|nr:sulfotransferase [Candidatus Poribacteria bacterium]